MPDICPFHLAIPTDDLDASRAFYTNVLGCTEGRSAENWVDFNFFGHQLSIHLCPDEVSAAKTNPVDGDAVPVRHFGVVLGWGAWCGLRDRIRSQNITFFIEPHVRFKGKPGEQGTMFFLDPCGNTLEFKGFKDSGELFAT